MNRIYFKLVSNIVIIGIIPLIFQLFPTSLFAQNKNSNAVLIINTYNQKGAPEKAIDYINGLPIEKQKDIQLEFVIAMNYYLLNDFKQAANLFVEINKIDNKYANYELAQCYAHLEKYDLAVKYLQSHLESKDRLMMHTIKSDVAFSSMAKSKEWISLWQTEWYSKYDLMLEDAWVEFDNENYEETLRILNQLNTIRKSLIEAYYLKALVYIKVGEPENALVSINEVLVKRDDNAKYYAIKANIEVALNKPKKALQSIETAIKLDSSQMDYYFIRAKAYLKVGKLDLAENDLEAMISLVPDFDVYKLAAEIYYEATEYQSALKAYNKCIEQQKYNVDLYIARGEVFEKLLAYEFAEQDYTMALDFTPFNGELYYRRGIVRKLQYKVDLACQDFHKAFNYKYMKADEELRGYCQGR